MSTQPKLKKIYFIDDDEATNAFHVALTKDLNLAESVHVFSNATDALTELKTITDKYDFPELIMVDINMPKVDGHEFSQQIQDMAGYNENCTCVALLTSSKDIRDVIKADENSIEQYLWKPLTEESVTELLKDALNIS